ncbi:MAG TPA: UDP-3-O-acyl-N-acetylglucosamine deacetylase [Thermoanaerobaculia bacterium]|nr:UDP-3-O-acyl-N-acetylglucosamine deacetylase [Thermoanaerobaculia bacterium]
MRAQSTLQRPLRVSGVGLHTGRHVDILLSPAPPGHGVVFYRSDVDRFIPALIEEAGALDHATTLGPRGREVATVEHLLSAAVGLGLDNFLVEVNGPEVPILDGSAAPWVAAIRHAGLVRQSVEIRPLVLTRTITLAGPGGKRIEVRPARELRVTYTIDFAHPAVGRQSVTVVVTPDSYARHLAPARTFGFLAEYEELKAHGLARGASMSNCIVIGPEGVENGRLRFADEFVRHKALDLVGDLALVGRPVLAHVIANRAGHELHAQLSRALSEELRANSPQALPAAGT